jgi:CheY-like chemotaxis protein
MRVLLVEDNPADARLFREALKDVTANSFELVHVERLGKAVDRMRHDQFDVLLLDLSLPDSHGLDTVARAHDKAPNIAIVVLTGMDDEALAVEALRKGAQDYLIKGQTDGRLLVRAMRYALERKRTVEERERLIDELQEALATVKKLSGLLPICASCKRIRDDKGYWEQIEQYIHEHSEATFTHGICPECARVLYPAMFRGDQGDKKKNNAHGHEKKERRAV